MKTIIIMAATIKEAQDIALASYGEACTYVKPFHYASRGNNFYEFQAPAMAGDNPSIIQSSYSRASI